MAYREPESSIYLLKGCPCDHEYNNSILFETKGGQWNYMKGLIVRSFTTQYYQRYNRGVLRIQAKADDLYECNYLVFSNDPRFNIMDVPSDDMKIFYCFIDYIAYINENVTEVHYNIDVIQTYMFDYTLGQCLVEREHTLTDEFYENLVEENITCDNYVYHTIRTQLLPNITSTKPLYSLMITYSPNEKKIKEFNTIMPNGSIESESGYYLSPTIDWEIEQSSSPQAILYPTGEVRNNTYTRTYSVFVDLPPFDSSAGIVKVRSLIGGTIHEMVDKQCTILYMQLVPRVFSHNPVPDEVRLTDYNTSSFSNSFNIGRATALYDVNNTSYAVKNKKLLTYPFCYLKVNNLNGEEISYLWEHFKSTESNHQFTIEGVNVCAPECKCTPATYAGIDNPYIEYSLSITDFPSSVWSEDTLLQYMSQNKTKIGFNLIKNAISDYMTLYTGLANPEGKWLMTKTTKTQEPTTITKKTLKSGTTKVSVKGGGYDVVKTPVYAEPTAYDDVETAVDMSNNFAMAAGLVDVAHKPDAVKGQADFSALRNIHNLYGYKFLQANIMKEDAIRIDNYFSMFGYAIKNIKVPNIFATSHANLRPHWNFIKTSFVVILPKQITTNRKRYVSEDVETALKAIYNNGITFWMNGEEVGDYSLDNSPVTQI